MTCWSAFRYVVVDVEGNGQQPPDLVELGTVTILDGIVGEPGAWLFRPGTPITAMARRVHGISNEDVREAPVFAGLAAGLRARLEGSVLVAHNAGVDLGILKRKLPGFVPADVLDTLKLSRRLLPGQPSYRLGSLVTALNLGGDIPPGLRPHRAAYDALATARLFVHLASQIEDEAVSFEVLRGDDAVLF